MIDLCPFQFGIIRSHRTLEIRRKQIATSPPLKRRGKIGQIINASVADCWILLLSVQYWSAGAAEWLKFKFDINIILRIQPCCESANRVRGAEAADGRHCDSACNTTSLTLSLYT